MIEGCQVFKMGGYLLSIHTVLGAGKDSLQCHSAVCYLFQNLEVDHASSSIFLTRFLVPYYFFFFPHIILYCFQIIFSVFAFAALGLLDKLLVENLVDAAPYPLLQ